MRKILFYFIFSLFGFNNCYMQDLLTYSPLWGVWTPAPKSKPYRIVELSTGLYYTTKQYVLEKERITIEPYQDGNKEIKAQIYGNGFSYKIIDFFKIYDGYKLLVEYSQGNLIFETGKPYEKILNRLIIIFHFINDNECLLEIEKTDGTNVLAFVDGRDNIYWREKVK